jgi:hypothetical protein
MGQIRRIFTDSHKIENIQFHPLQKDLEINQRI